MTLIVTVVLASLVGSFLCSLCEAALYAVTPAQVEVLRRGRIPGSDRLAKLRQRIDEPRSHFRRRHVLSSATR